MKQHNIIMQLVCSLIPGFKLKFRHISHILSQLEQ